MTPWTAIAKALGHESTRAMWEDLYVTKKRTLADLATQLGVSVGSIRKQLQEDGIALRGRGSGRGTTKIKLSDDLVTEIRRDGCQAVAKRLGVSYSTVYKALRRQGLGSRGLPSDSAPQPEPFLSATGASHPPGSDGPDESR